MQKLKYWIKKTGLTNLTYAGLFALAWVYGHNMLAGAFAGIFLYSNWNTVRKMVSASIPGGGIKKPKP